MSAIKDSYYLLYYTIFRLGVGGTSREYRKWGALLGVGVVQFFLLATGDIWLEIATGVSRLLSLPRYAIAAFVVGLCYLNYMALLHRSQWEAYEEKFNRYPRRGQNLRLTVAAVFIVLVVAGLLYSINRPGRWIGRT